MVGWASSSSSKSFDEPTLLPRHSPNGQSRAYSPPRTWQALLSSHGVPHRQRWQGNQSHQRLPATPPAVHGQPVQWRCASRACLPGTTRSLPRSAGGLGPAVVPPPPPCMGSARRGRTEHTRQIASRLPSRGQRAVPPPSRPACQRSAIPSQYAALLFSQLASSDRTPLPPTVHGSQPRYCTSRSRACAVYLI